MSIKRMHYLLIAVIGLVCGTASAAPSTCSQVGAKTFCSTGGATPIRAFGSCWKARVDAAQRGGGAKLVPNWLEPAESAASCMAEQGVTEAAPPKSAGKEFCTEQGDVGTQGMLRLCRAGADRDAYVVAESYCRQLATTFLELGMLQPNGGGFDPINLALIAPCLRAQGWSIDKVAPRGAKPHQRVGATGSL